MTLDFTGGFFSLAVLTHFLFSQLSVASLSTKGKKFCQIPMAEARGIGWGCLVQHQASRVWGNLQILATLGMSTPSGYQ